MMAQRNLHELLSKDQEPFLLKDYIANRRHQLKRPVPKTQIQLKRRKPILESSTFPHNFCKNACFLSYHDSPDLRKSPLFEFPSPAKSPCKSPNAIFLHVPARTAALLLEAALRIQKHSAPSKPKTQNKTTGFGLFGSILKRLTHRNRTRKREIGVDGVRVSVKDILRWDSAVGRRKLTEESHKMQTNMLGDAGTSASDQMGFSCSCNGRLSSAVWSESNEEKSTLDLETSSSSDDSEGSEAIDEFVSNDTEVEEFASGEKSFCENPFRFAPQKNTSPGCHTPDFPSPAPSPSRHTREEKVNYEEEEEKEQCSPVSVLDPPFNDDDDGHEVEEEEEDFDLECSFAVVQRAKQQLLQKLRRFEKLAELDPIELEKRMVEEQDDDDDDEEDLDEEVAVEEESELSDREKNVDDFIREVVSKSSSLHHHWQIPKDMKRLVGDLFAEESLEASGSDDSEAVAKRVCKRLESWKEVESNTIDMMVELDFRRELDEWKRNQEQVGDTAVEIELAIFGLLVEELSEELSPFT